MRKLLLSLTLLLATASAMAQDENPTIKAWYKTWLTPTECVTGVCDIEYDEFEDTYTVATGLAGNDLYPFLFKFVPNGEELPLLSLWYYYTNDWVSASDWTYVLYNDYYSACIDAGEYYWLLGSLTDTDSTYAEGSLYIPQLAYDTTGVYTCANYYHTPSLVWPYKAPAQTIKGSYTDGRTGVSRECDLDVYEDGEYVIKAFNGIHGYDIPFADGDIIYFEQFGSWYTPQLWEGYDFYIHDLMAVEEGTPGRALNAKNVSVNIAGGELSISYVTTVMGGWNGAEYSVEDATVYTDTFKWNPEELSAGVSTVKAEQNAPREVYNLGGQRMSSTGKGIRVVRENGQSRKVIF